MSDNIFSKNLYNKDIRWQIVGAKTINTLADAFELAHHSLFKLKKYEGLIYNDECEVAEINQIVVSSKYMDRNNSIKPSGECVSTLIGVFVGSVVNLASSQRM